MLLKLLFVALVSMLPLVELRGSIPIAAGMGMPIVPSLIIAMIGNLVPMPFVFAFAHDFLTIGSRSKIRIIRKICRFCLKKGEQGGKKLQKNGDLSIYIALFLFVGIPLPGTGAWTGTLAASFLELDFKKTMIAIGCGVLLAGTIMLALSFGVFGQLFD